jgi:short-subunit dehydrogenase
MKQIQIDLEVYKAIVGNMETFDETPNDVLRKIFNIEMFSLKPLVNQTNAMVVRMHYQGKLFIGTMAGRAISYNGKTYNSPSKASTEITGTNRNGWRDWEYKDLLGNWQSINNLRQSVN